MGKGIGKLSTWFTQLYGGTFIVEFRNLRRGRALYFSKQISSRLPVSTKFCEQQTTSIKLHGSARTNFKHSITK